MDEKGNTVGLEAVWTGTKFDGTVKAPLCNDGTSDWTSNKSTDAGCFGESDKITLDWTEKVGHVMACNSSEVCLYCISCDSTPPVFCNDVDADGFDDCDIGDVGDDGKIIDCCDDGTEASMGCNVANRASMYPGAVEICGDNIDQDCNGSDLACDCDSDKNLCETGATCPGFTCNGGTCWGRGGEASPATCCGDSGDSEHYNYRRDSGGNTCDNINNERCSFGGDDSSDDGCCADSLLFIGSTKCIYNNTCYEANSGIDVDGSGRIGAICWRGPIPPDGTWIDCDFNEDSCQVFGGYAGAYVQSADGAFGEYQDESTTECCGDDANEFLATAGPGIAAHGSKCCDSSLGHTLVAADGSCTDCIANGQSDGGDSSWCCSNYSQGGICCASGTCCATDSQCPSDSCAECSLVEHYCDDSSGDYNCKTKNKSCDAGTHCSGNSCAPANEICGNGADEDCDGIAQECCHWQDDGCGAHDCDIWTKRGEICMPDPCECVIGDTDCCKNDADGIRCVDDELCSTFGLPNRPILEILLDVVDWLLGIIAALAMLMLVIGGIMYMSSTGDPIKIETAKKIVVYAIIGLAIAGVSYAVIRVVFGMLR